MRTVQVPAEPDALLDLHRIDAGRAGRGVQVLPVVAAGAGPGDQRAATAPKREEVRAAELLRDRHQLGPAVEQRRGQKADGLAALLGRVVVAPRRGRVVAVPAHVPPEGVAPDLALVLLHEAAQHEVA